MNITITQKLLFLFGGLAAVLMLFMERMERATVMSGVSFNPPSPQPSPSGRGDKNMPPFRAVFRDSL
jgi:hypothetical protein